MTTNSLPDYRIVAILSTAPGHNLPWNYLEHMQGWLYKKLSASPLGLEIHKAPFSLFNYSLIPLNARNTADGCASEIGSWVFRFASARTDLLEKVYALLQEESTIELDYDVLGISTVIKEQLSNNFVLEAQPITIIKKDNSGFVSPDDNNFSQAVNASLKNRWRFFSGAELPDLNFCFTEQPRKRIFNYKNRHLVSFQGMVRLGASGEALKFAQCVGLGNKTSCGFGMVN